MAELLRVNNLKRNVGKAYMISVILIRNVSTAPPRNPAMDPIITPIISTTIWEPNPINSAFLIAYKFLLNISLPKSSVPHQNLALGGSKV